MQKNPEKWLKPWQMGTHLKVLSESYLMDTNMTGFRRFSKKNCILVLWTKVASALEGLIVSVLPSCPENSHNQGLPLRFQAMGPKRSFDKN